MLIISLKILYLQIIYNFLFNMKTGKVKFFNESKGYGFISDDESNKEYFVHITDLIDRINEGDSVSFDLQEGRKGLNAVKVKQL